MQLERKDSLLSEFVGLAIKYQAYDSTYKDLSHSDGVFTHDAVERAYIVFLHIRLRQDDSNIRNAFNQWRNFNFGESRRIDVFFKFVEALNSHEVTNIWEYKWDARDRNISVEHEYLCRIFILSGITTQMSFYGSGTLQ